MGRRWVYAAGGLVVALGASSARDLYGVFLAEPHCGDAQVLRGVAQRLLDGDRTYTDIQGEAVRPGFRDPGGPADHRLTGAAPIEPGAARPACAARFPGRSGETVEVVYSYEVAERSLRRGRVVAVEVLSLSAE
jgi:hypothetical protein